MTNKVTVIFNVHDVFIEYLNVRDLDDTMVVTVKYSSRWLRKTYISKKANEFKVASK